mmetsp:Transcript_3143/g.10376  ORF Transcript_3143/g.10376 Transcript_3143/m.10376 type:complete len:220 (-) Transcript_3143:301-960(-)
MEPRGSAALSDTPYTLFASSSDGRRAGSWPYLCTLLAVLLGTGVHASKEALVPSEKSLEALGLSPVCYSALTITPVALGIVTPLAWGRLWDTRAALVLVGAPLGELVGSGLTACGLFLARAGITVPRRHHDRRVLAGRPRLRQERGGWLWRAGGRQARNGLADVVGSSHFARRRRARRRAVALPAAPPPRPPRHRRLLGRSPFRVAPSGGGRGRRRRSA